jgi:hypothetical protein
VARSLWGCGTDLILQVQRTDIVSDLTVVSFACDPGMCTQRRGADLWGSGLVQGSLIGKGDTGCAVSCMYMWEPQCIPLGSFTVPSRRCCLRLRGSPHEGTLGQVSMGWEHCRVSLEGKEAGT